MQKLQAIVVALAAFVFAGGYASATQAAPVAALAAMSTAAQGDAVPVQYRRRCRQVAVKRCKKRWIGQKCRTTYEEVCDRRGRDRDDYDYDRRDSRRDRDRY